MIAESLKEVFENLPRKAGAQKRNLFLIYSVEVWKLVVSKGIYSFTDEELNKGETNEDGYIGTQCGVDCYVAKPFK